jgi:glycerol-3-phosphate cytidylyltransferase
MVVVITFGTFDLLHIGHINMLNACKKYGDKLIVGVSSDKLNYTKKNRYPIFKQEDRMEIIKNIECVDDVFLEESLEMKEEYIRKYNADIFIIGDDWKGKFDDMCSVCKVKYLNRTENISTTDIISRIKSHL